MGILESVVWVMYHVGYPVGSRRLSFEQENLFAALSSLFLRAEAHGV